MPTVAPARKFHSVTDLINAASAPVTIPERRGSQTGTRKFTGTDSFDEAVKLARQGWHDGTEAIDRFQARIVKLMAGTIPVPENRYAVRGQRLNVARYLAGMPNPYIKRVDSAMLRKVTRPRHVVIQYNITTSGAISADTILTRGAAMVVLINTLERRNVRCEVNLAFCSQTGLNAGDKLEYTVRVKQASEHVSIDKLAFFLGHAASLRRLFFSLMEHEDDATRQRFGVGRSYGLPGEATDQGDIYLGRILSTTDWSDELTLAWLKKALADQGISLETESIK